MTREHFDSLLQELRDEVLAMGVTVTATIGSCMKVLREHDLEGAHRLVDDDIDIDRKRHDIERRAFVLIATQQPLARDLRAITTDLAIATELERIGDYCEGIASLTLRMGEGEPLPLQSEVLKMAALAQQLLSSALDAFGERDLTTAARVWSEDDRMDVLYERFFAETMDAMGVDPGAIQQGTYLLWVAHNLERIGDRATNIAERLSFMVTGDMNAFHPSLQPSA
jgi:phosphate transport system protein